ncbi:coiled-coil domain-containing protein 33 [Apus apus]|uniref:coiled-coil domain-containing protein 33 n=1 Tax=Apus apus TaxID=8895 RepID=UPI0021F85130|nr:coiled-coil domain-containing protein 33 [Apus apus]
MAGGAGEPHTPLQHSRLRAEEKTLDFEFEVVSAQFNQRGRYCLRLTVENPLLQGSGAGVQLRVGRGEVIQSSTCTTDIIQQGNLDQIYSFQRRKFTFTLPRGFCKNDKNHDVRLHLEVLRFPARAERAKRSRRVGEAYFAIYPRPDQPRMKLSAGRDEDWYRYSSVLALLRAGSEQPAMHCGRLAFTASLHEHRPPPPLSPPLPLSPGTQRDRRGAGTAPASSSSLAIPALSRSLPTPESAYHSLPPEGRARSPQRLRADPALSSSPELPGESAEERPSSSSSSSSSSLPAPRRALSCSSFHLFSPGSSPDLASSLVQVSESPAGREEPRPAGGAGRGHVAQVGKEAITVTLHGATNLPATREGRVPWPYVIVKTSRGDEQKAETTRPSWVPTHSPSWGEELTVEMDAEDVGRAALTLTLADQATKEALGTFQLPVRHLQPFQPHHCRLVLPRPQDPVGTVLHVTITRKRSFLPPCPGFSHLALEVLLQGLSAPLANPPGVLVAVARVVTKMQEYKHLMEKHPMAWPGVSPTTITFPDPPAAAFSITPAANTGCPQMSRPAGPSEQPTWDTSFLFQGRDLVTIFSEDTALVIEYYPHKAIWEAAGTLIPMGYSVLPLTSRVFRALVARKGRMQVDGLAVQGTHLKTTSGASPTVGLCLQLLPSELHRDDGSLPEAEAVTSILPGKQPFPQGTGAPPEGHRSQEISRDSQELVSAGQTGGEGDTRDTRRDSSVPEAALGTEARLLLEGSRYRLALQRMAGDILSLRQQIISLEVENGHLRRSVARQEELGQALLTDGDLDVMTREELLDRLATLKGKLAASTVETRELKDRVQQLQNELIRKNDRERELVLLQRAHRQQQAALRRCQQKVAKMKGLEETVRQQEKVIEVMERVLQEKLAGVGRSTEKPAGEALSGEVYTALLAENRKLREELAGPPRPSPPTAPRPPALTGGFGGPEKLSLLAKLEEAQTRGRALERQNLLAIPPRRGHPLPPLP